MIVTLKLTEAQQKFGAMLDRAPGEGDIIVERYGSPCVAIVNYRRYQALVAAEKELIRLRLQRVSTAATAHAGDLSNSDLDDLIQEARTETNSGRKQ